MKFYNSNYQIQHLNFNHNKEREILEKLRDKPFWIWDKLSHEKEYDRTGGLCCFNHSLPSGLPVKDGVRKPIYSWQKQIVDALTSDSDADLHIGNLISVRNKISNPVTEFITQSEIDSIDQVAREFFSADFCNKIFRLKALSIKLHQLWDIFDDRLLLDHVWHFLGAKERR